MCGNGYDNLALRIYDISSIWKAFQIFEVNCRWAHYVFRTNQSCMLLNSDEFKRDDTTIDKIEKQPELGYFLPWTSTVDLIRIPPSTVFIPAFLFPERIGCKSNNRESDTIKYDGIERIRKHHKYFR